MDFDFTNTASVFVDVLGMAIFMKNIDKKYYLLNYIFISGILLLFLNDHYFKWEFSNWLTGKLSDFIGVIIFPMFLTYFFPKRKLSVFVFTGLFFTFWKSPYSQYLIDAYNEIALIKITRVVDFSDLIALLLLPFSYYLIKILESYKSLHLYRTKLHSIIVIICSVFVFMATSPPRSHYFTFSDGNLKFFNTSTKIKMSKTEILDEMKQNNINAYLDTKLSSNFNDSLKGIYPIYYKVDTIIINKDTIIDFQFSLERISDNKTKIYLNGMTIPKNIQETEVKKELRKYYRKLIKRHIKTIFRNQKTYSTSKSK